MNIVFLCPPAGVINGGTRHIYRMAEALTDSGHDVMMFEQEGKRPPWFRSSIPVVGQGVLKPNADQAFVLPEDQPQLLASIKSWPQKKVIYSQNHFYGAMGIGNAESYADYGVTHILCSSKTIFDHAQIRHPKLRAFIIPCAIDRELFKPLPKQKRIIYMPRKRMIESNYIRDMFRFLYPQHRDWDWTAVHDRPELDVARMIGEASVFLSLSRLEGFGLTPLEAMSAECVVAGFTGIGGWEYACDENGFWADEDDFPTCIAGLAQAIALTEDNEKLIAYRNACEATLSAYTKEKFVDAVTASWAEIATL